MFQGVLNLAGFLDFESWPKDAAPKTMLDLPTVLWVALPSVRPSRMPLQTRCMSTRIGQKGS